MKIFVGCSSSNDILNQYKEDCKDLLSKIFENQNDLVFGAYDSGLMGISYNNALSNNRSIIGICPQSYQDDFKSLQCTKEITTKSVSERTDYLISESDMLLFLPGGIGTIYELFTSIESKRCHEHDKTIVIYNSCNYYDILLEFLEKVYGENFTSPKVKTNYFISDSKEEIITYINSIKKSNSKILKKQ